MHKYPLSFHFKELKTRLVYILVSYVMAVAVIYYFSSDIYQFLAEPLSVSTDGVRPAKIIYTSLTEVFFSYLSLSTTLGFLFTMPIIAYNFYKFIEPGLYKHEKRLAVIILGLAPILYWLGILFCYFLVIPKAWAFFISFEKHNVNIPIVLEARVSEYLQLVVDLTFAFGVAFQVPVVLLILTLLGVISSQTLEDKRRFAIVIIFIIGGILTPPDIFSQFALAIPMLLLYEISIRLSKIIENKGNINVRPGLDS